MFECPETVKMEELFFDFIILCFPESKVSRIFKQLLEEGSITQEVYDSKIAQLAIRIKASKRSYKDLFNANI